MTAWTLFCGRPFSVCQTCRLNCESSRCGSSATARTPQSASSGTSNATKCKPHLKGEAFGRIGQDRTGRQRRSQTASDYNGTQARAEACDRRRPKPSTGGAHASCFEVSRAAFMMSDARRLPFGSFARVGSRRSHMRTATVIRAFVASALLLSAGAGRATMLRARWRAATQEELRRVIPARAPVVKENIETEFRTASGVTDGRGRFIAGVVMITAGYSAEGKYSHFFITQAALKIGDLVLEPGEYVFGYRRLDNDTIRITFYRAATGEAVGDADAHVNRKSAMVRSLLINPPAGGKATIQIGRYLLDYRVSD